VDKINEVVNRQIEDDLYNAQKQAAQGQQNLGERAGDVRDMAANQVPQLHPWEHPGIGGSQINAEYRQSQREEAEKRVGYHRTEADRADRALAFFRSHPEFDEFINLIRQGVISI
jgi:hypothetical protein